MGIYVVKDAQLYLAQHDLSGVSNEVGMTYEGDEVERTTMGPDGAKQFMAGLLVSRLNANGLVEYADGGYDEEIYQRMGLSRTPLTVGPEGGADGALAFFVQANQASYQTGASVGELLAYTLTAVGTDTKLVRGKIMLTGSKEESGNGVVRQLGAVSATQKLYAALHVFTVAGAAPTLAVKVQSSSAEGFAGPTDRITFAGVTTAATAEFKASDGPITDTWYRINYTLGGAAPVYGLAIVVGIV